MHKRVRRFIRFLVLTASFTFYLSSLANIPTARASGNTVSFGPVADTYVNQVYPRRNYGTAKSLQMSSSPDLRIYLRFNVQGLSGVVRHATLRLYAISSSSGGFEVHTLSDNRWGETTTTFNNAPALLAPVIVTSGPYNSNTWIDLDVTSAVRGNGFISFGIRDQTKTTKNLASRESGATAPELVVQTDATSLYWGAYINGVPWDLSRLDAFETNTNRRVSIVHWGEPWIHNGAWQPFFAGDFDRVRARGALPLLDWGSWDYALGVDQPNFRLSEIYGGKFDAYVTQWAVGAKTWGHPLFLRFDWEMNGWWQFPWSEQLNGNRSGDYVKAWKHVHDLFAQVGATNVTWVWCPNVVSSGTTPLPSLYPGDAYVDWLGMDGYNWGIDRGNVWQSFSQVFGSTYDQLTLLAPARPIMIAETASSENGGSKAAWIKDTLTAQLPHNYSRVKAFVWFDWNDGDPSITWPIASSDASINAFATGINSTDYTTNQFANANTSPIPPLQ